MQSAGNIKGKNIARDKYYPVTEHRVYSIQSPEMIGYEIKTYICCDANETN